MLGREVVDAAWAKRTSFCEVFLLNLCSNLVQLKSAMQSTKGSSLVGVASSDFLISKSEKRCPLRLFVTPLVEKAAPGFHKSERCEGWVRGNSMIGGERAVFGSLSPLRCGALDEVCFSCMMQLLERRGERLSEKDAQVDAQLWSINER